MLCSQSVKVKKPVLLPAMSGLFGSGFVPSAAAAPAAPPAAPDRYKSRLNQLIRAHNTHVDESKSLRSDLAAAETFNKTRFDTLDESLSTYIHQNFEEMDALRNRVQQLEELVSNLARDLLAVLHVAESGSKSTVSAE